MNTFALLVGMQTGAATVEINMEIPQKLKMGLPFDPVIPLLGIYPKEPKTLIQKNISTPMFIAALFTITKFWKHPITFVSLLTRKREREREQVGGWTFSIVLN